MEALMSPENDRREDIRASLRVSFLLKFAGKSTKIITHDISRSGALIQGRIIFPVGTLLVLEHPGFNQPQGGAVRVRFLVRVVNSRRGFPVKGEDSAMGVSWIRAFSDFGQAELRVFLGKLFRFSDLQLDQIQETSSSTYFDFSGVKSLKDIEHPAFVMPKRGIRRNSGKDQERIEALNANRYTIDIGVVYGVDNVHYKGRAVFIGKDGLTIVPSQALPKAYSKCVIRFPLKTGRMGDKVLLYGDIEAVVDSMGSGEPCFSVKVERMDEGDTPGAYRHFVSQRAFAGTQL
jgi:hypothetical protein